MKTYLNEQNFVENFAKDVKIDSTFEVNGKQFTATYAGKNSGMQAVYSVTIDGNTKQLNITQLKKRLGVTYTREQNRTGESRANGTRFVEKTEQELMQTATNEYTKYVRAFHTILEFAGKHCSAYPADSKLVTTNFTDTFAVIDPRYNSDGDAIFHIMDYYKAEQEKRKAEQAAKAMQAAKEKAQKQAETIKQLLSQGMDKDELRALLGL